MPGRAPCRLPGCGARALSQLGFLAGGAGGEETAGSGERSQGQSQPGLGLGRRWCLSATLELLGISLFTLRPEVGLRDARLSFFTASDLLVWEHFGGDCPGSVCRNPVQQQQQKTA